MARSSLFRLLSKLVFKGSQQARLSANHSYPNRKLLLQRRRFLQLAALAGGSLSAVGLAHPQAAAQQDPKVAIIGSGLAGLTAAYYLQKLGIRATVYEAKSILGGRVQSQSPVNPALVNDLGGSFVNQDHEDILALAEDFDLTLFDRYQAVESLDIPPVLYRYQDQSWTEPEVAAQLRDLAAQIGQDYDRLDQDFEAHVQVLDPLSVADYLDQHADKIPSPWIRSFVETGIRSEYGVEPEESSALQLIYNLPSVDGDEVEPIASDETYLVEGGSAGLIKALAQRLEGQIETRWVLKRIEPDGEGFVLSFDPAGGSQGTVAADYVILAIPFPALRRVEIGVDLPAGLRQFIAEVGLGRNEKVLAGFQQRAWLTETGFSIETWADGIFSQIWDDTQRQGDQPEAVLTYFLGGNNARSAAASASTLGSQVVAASAAWLPELGTAQTERYFRTSWGEDPFIGGGYTNFRPGQYLKFAEYLYTESEDPDERVDVHVGSLVFAGEQFSDEYYGYMNGAAQTGRLAAEVVAGLIQG